jgi:hypothetical protein
MRPAYLMRAGLTMLMLLGLGQGVGESLAVGAGALQAQAFDGAVRTDVVGPGKQVGMTGGIVGEGSVAWLAQGWQEAGIEGILSFTVSLALIVCNSLAYNLLSVNGSR